MTWRIGQQYCIWPDSYTHKNCHWLCSAYRAYANVNPGLLWTGNICSLVIIIATTLLLQATAMGPVFNMCLPVCLSVCGRTITFERNDLWPRYLARWFIVTLYRPSLKVNVIGLGQSSLSSEENVLECWVWPWMRVF